MSASNVPQIDPAMLELFQAEMDAHIPVLNEGLLALEKGQAGAREIEAMMRAAHSIKGAARIVGIEPAVRVAHAMEDCFTAAKENRVTLNSDAVDVLLVGVDALQRICAPLADSPVSETSLSELLQRLTVLKSANETALAAPAIDTRKTAAPRQVATDLVSATIQTEEPSVTLPAVFDQASAESLRRELLDTLSLEPRRIQLDFSQVNQLCADALALLACFARDAGRMQIMPAIESRGMCPAVGTILRVAGLDKAFGIGVK